MFQVQEGVVSVPLTPTYSLMLTSFAAVSFPSPMSTSCCNEYSKRITEVPLQSVSASAMGRGAQEQHRGAIEPLGWKRNTWLSLRPGGGAKEREVWESLPGLLPLGQTADANT